MFAILLLLLIFLPSAILLWNKFNLYKNSTYNKETQNSFWKVMRDAGLSGEFFTTQYLEKVKGYHKTLLNCYLPNDKGGTSEVDVIFLHEMGIYVMESKNYSGWIFGNEKDHKWCQVLPNKHKEFFYNPIKQNQTHIRVLQSVLDFVPSEQFVSVVVFSERCELKKVTYDQSHVSVMKRNVLQKFMNQAVQTRPNLFTKEEIDRMYHILKPFSNATTEVKEQHIQRVSSIK